jgi:hypothetical protein
MVRKGVLRVSAMFTVAVSQSLGTEARGDLSHDCNALRTHNQTDEDKATKKASVKQEELVDWSCQ